LSPTPASESALPTSAASDAIEKFLTETLTDDGSLVEPGTSQNLAFKKLLATNPGLDPSQPNDQLEIIQRYVLNAVYYAGSGDQWTVNDGWTTASNVCDPGGSLSWSGITCDEDMHVISIELGENNVFGTIPSEIQGLSMLKRYDANTNSLYGIIPATIGQLGNLGKLGHGGIILPCYK
jgi:hypothetical protein